MENGTKNTEMKLNYKRTFLLGVVFLSITMLNSAHDDMTSVILFDQFGISDFYRNAIMAIDNVFALFMLPIFGKLSDACNSSWGKRKPYVFWGTIAACIFLALFPVALKLNNLAMFIVAACFFLFTLGIYRSAGVALVADVTIKPLRSKANAIINLMGAAAFILGKLITMFLYKDINVDTGVRDIPIVYAFLGYILIAVICLVIYMVFIPEKKWTKEREETEDKLHLEEEPVEEEKAVSSKKFLHTLDPDHRKSFILILLSIMFWTFGYNAVTTNYSVYSKVVLGITDGGFATPALVGGIAGFIAYIPVGWMASKIGRRKTILGGLILALISFIIAYFIRGNASWIMYVVFVLVGVAQAAIVVNTLPMVVEFADRKTIGKFTGYYYLATQIAQTCTPFLIGLIMAALSDGMATTLRGNLALFPYACVFMVLSFVPLLFVKHGDAKAIPVANKLEAFEVDD